MATESKRKRKPKAEEKSAPISAGTEVGSTGLKRFHGYVTEEWLNELRGYRGIKTYQEMSDNDATVAAIVFAIKMICRSVEWKIDPFSDDPADREVAEFVESNLHDMSRPWSDTIAEILSMLVYGWSYHEIVYKYRRGYLPDREWTSKFDDGMLGWKKLPIRAQDTLVRWEFDEETGQLLGMVQQAPPHYRVVEIPMTKALLFRTDTHKDNPEGRSILRSAYRPWYMKRHIENVEAIGVERDLAGLPYAKVPGAIMADDASPEDKAVFEHYKKVITNLKRDEQEGVIFPSDRDESGNLLYELTLLSSGGTRNFKTTEIVNRYKQDIAQSVLADFILLGHEKVGSYALAGSKTSIFSVALSSFLNVIKEEFNRVAIPDLLGVNGKDPSRSPKLSHGDLEAVDLAAFGAIISALSGAGMPLFPDGDLEKHIRKMLKLPVTEHQHYDAGTPGDLDGTPPVVDQAEQVTPPETADVKTGVDTTQQQTETVDDTLKQVALNGAQVASLVDIVAKVATGELPRASGKEIITTAFALDDAKAEKILGQAGLNLPAKPAAEPDPVVKPDPVIP